MYEISLQNVLAHLAIPLGTLVWKPAFYEEGGTKGRSSLYSAQEGTTNDKREAGV